MMTDNVWGKKCSAADCSTKQNRMAFYRLAEVIDVVGNDNDGIDAGGGRGNEGDGKDFGGFDAGGLSGVGNTIDIPNPNCKTPPFKKKCNVKGFIKRSLAS
jgi:hypothetical protein